MKHFRGHVSSDGNRQLAKEMHKLSFSTLKVIKPKILVIKQSTRIQGKKNIDLKLLEKVALLAA